MPVPNHPAGGSFSHKIARRLCHFPFFSPGRGNIADVEHRSVQSIPRGSLHGVMAERRRAFPRGELFFNQGGFAAAPCVTASAPSRSVQQCRKNAHRRTEGEPLATIQPEIRKEWLQTLDRAFEGLARLSVGLAQAMKTLKALQSETSDFPVNLPVPDLGQPVLI